MDFTEWSKLALICILGAMSPGPSLAVILRISISGNRKQGIFAGIGHGLGITFYAVIAILGLVTSLRSTEVPINNSVSPNVSESSNSTTAGLPLYVILIGIKVIMIYLSIELINVATMRDLILFLLILP